MIIKKLDLSNFKNYSRAELEFSPKVNCLLGSNGAGKTNILDAIYYLSFCKSYFNPMDNQNIRRGEDFFRISGKYNKPNNPPDTVQVLLKKNQRKQVKRNNKEYDRLSDHIGLYPLVMITPSDTSLIHEGSESRRKFIDGIISQFDKNYLLLLLQYTKAIHQRNTLLKKFTETGRYDRVSIDIWDQKIIALAPQIHAVRKAFLKSFVPTFEKYFRFIAGSNEKAGLLYESQLNESSMKALLDKNNEKDRILKYTSVGPHKDDYAFSVNRFPLKKFASQGQQKSFIVAAKLAQYEHIKNIKGDSPVILLDDVFDKLDQKRVNQLMTLVSENNFGQIFITDTQKDRILKAFENIDTDKKYYEISSGRIINIYK
ncbi:MAG: DNA replication/repair protein RecF [Bacteroidales bacterium]